MPRAIEYPGRGGLPVAGEAAVYAPTFPGPPCRLVPQPLCLPPCGLAHSHCFLCWRPWRWSGPWVRRCRCWASTQQKPALQGGRGQKKGAAGLWTTWPSQKAATSPRCFSGMCLGPRRDPPGSVYRGRAWGCLASLMSPTQLHSCSPSGALPEPQHGWGCGPSSPHGSRVEQGPTLSTDAKWSRPCPG